MLSDTVLSGHPLLSGQFSKSQKSPVIKWSPLLSGRGHHLRSPNGTFSIVVTFILKKVTRCQVLVHTVSNNVTLEVQQLISLFIFVNH